MPTNWETITQLPPETNLLFTEFSCFKKDLLPLPTKERQVKITCLICTGKPWSWVKLARDHSQTSNLWQHLKAKHKRKFNEIKAKNAEISSTTSNTTQSSNRNSITPFTITNGVVEITPTELRRFIIQFIISNNLPF